MEFLVMSIILKLKKKPLIYAHQVKVKTQILYALCYHFAKNKRLL